MKKTIITALFICVMYAGNVLAVETGNGDIHGFISQGYLRSDDNNYYANTEDGTFQFREMGVNYGTWIFPGLRGGFQLVAVDLGDTGNNEVYVDWAYLDYKCTPWLGVRAGRIKKPFGLYNETRDIDMLRTSILLPQSVYFEAYRESNTNLDGAGLYGTVPLSMLGSLSYQIEYGDNSIDSDGGVATTIEGSLALQGMSVDIVKIESNPAYVLQIEWATPLDGLRLLVSRLGSNMEIKSNFTEPYPFVPIADSVMMDMGAELTVYSAEYVWNDLTLAAECLSQKLDIETSLGIMGYVVPAEKLDQEMWGYYYNAAYRFTNWFELGAYYSAFYHNRDDKNGSAQNSMGLPNYDPDYLAWLKDTCVSLKFNLSDNWIFKLEGHDMNGVSFINPLANPPDENGDRYTKDWMLWAAKLTFHF